MAAMRRSPPLTRATRCRMVRTGHSSIPGEETEKSDCRLVERHSLESAASSRHEPWMVSTRISTIQGSRPSRVAIRMVMHWTCLVPSAPWFQGAARPWAYGMVRRGSVGGSTTSMAGPSSWSASTSPVDLSPLLVRHPFVPFRSDRFGKPATARHFLTDKVEHGALFYVSRMMWLFLIRVYGIL